ncbi:hypothetical protein [Lentilactobacillus rapi]|uniref:Uncharacterized protein n=1 Tax=Lentilactobacillus rapi TaxID=481723 RepID=A0A512PL99_9LACO|nr:hypothetical protein [Lentilactobacillus rapi]GEP71989.1 hypothetical protein LRA02_08570 [Lentilactobacillus rapi]
MKVTVNLDHVDEGSLVEAVIKQLVPPITEQVTKALQEKYKNETLTKEQVCDEVFKCSTETFDKFYKDCPRVPQGRQAKYNREECIKYFKRQQIFA